MTEVGSPRSTTPLATKGAVRTDVGRVRRENEDAFGFFPELAAYVVADGIGGHAAGRVASTLTVEEIRRSLLETADEDLTPVVDAQGRSSVGGRRLMIALAEANQRVLDASRSDPRMHGMGTTVAAVLFDAVRNLVAVCHVGDTRVYRIRGARIEQLTEDHSLVQRLLREGKLAAEDVASSAHRHVLTQAIGTSEIVSPDLRLEKPEAGDIYLMSSDGVHDLVASEEILQIVLGAGDDLDAACAHLIELANERAGKDNSTVLVVVFSDPDGRDGGKRPGASG